MNEHGTPLFILDHDKLRANYRTFKKNLPRVQCYYAVKANTHPEIIKTLFLEGSSFDVASYNEFMQIYEYIQHYEEKDKDFFIWDKIIFSNTIKDRETLSKIKRYRPLVTFDNSDEVKKIKACCDTAGLVLRLKVPDTGSQVEMSSKFGAEPADAGRLIRQAFDAGLVVEGLSFHVGSQCTNFDNYTAALAITSEIMNDARARGYDLKIIDIGGGFPVPYDSQVPEFEKLAKAHQLRNQEALPRGHRDHGGARKVHRRDRGAARHGNHRQVQEGREDFLLHQRRRLPHVLRRGVRPLDPEFHRVQEGRRRGMRRGRADLRQF